MYLKTDLPSMTVANALDQGLNSIYVY